MCQWKGPNPLHRWNQAYPNCEPHEFNITSAMTRNKHELSLLARYNTLSPTTLTSYDPKSLVICLGLDLITWNQKSHQVFRNAKACLHQRNFAQHLCKTNADTVFWHQRHHSSALNSSKNKHEWWILCKYTIKWVSHIQFLLEVPHIKFDCKQFIGYKTQCTFIVLLCTNMHKNQIHIKFYTESLKEFMAYMEKSNYGLM